MACLQQAALAWAQPTPAPSRLFGLILFLFSGLVKPYPLQRRPPAYEVGWELEASILDTLGGVLAPVGITLWGQSPACAAAWGGQVSIMPVVPVTTV